MFNVEEFHANDKCMIGYIYPKSTSRIYGIFCSCKYLRKEPPRAPQIQTEAQFAVIGIHIGFCGGGAFF